MRRAAVGLSILAAFAAVPAAFAWTPFGSGVQNTVVPSILVTRAGTERIDSFDLDDGSGKTHEVTSQPGIYQVTVSAGRDAASWSMRVQDYY